MMTLVDGGALQMAVNALRRADKHEIADALIATAIRGEFVDAAEVRSLREENEKLWMTFGKTADVLGIDTKAERKIPGAPSDVFIREIEQLQKDAERYRWLRDAGAAFYTEGPEITDGSDKVHVCEFAMDVAIDAARGEK